MLPGPLQAIGRMEVAQVKLPVGALSQVKQHWRDFGVTLSVNWAVKPFSMALLGWIFIRHVFAPWLPAGQLDSYIAGLILLAAAPCTAMVFVWSRLTNGHPLFTLSQVALNDTIMVFAFAPIVALLLGLSSIVVPWDTLITSVVLYIVIPVLIAQVWRKALLAKGQAAFDATLARIGPWSITALLATLVLLFAFQGEAILRQPLVIAMLAVPILIQVFFNSALAYWLNRRLGESHSVACPSGGACGQPQQGIVRGGCRGLSPAGDRPSWSPPHGGLPGGTRTPDLLLRRQLLYPVELRAVRRREVVVGVR